MANSQNSSTLVGALLATGLIVFGAYQLGVHGGFGGARKPAGGGPAATAFKLPLLRGPGDYSFTPGDGKVTLVDFWATWCGPCREELPTINALHHRYQDKGVQVVAVDAEPAEAREFAERLATQLRLDLPIALAGDTVAETYRVSNLPHLAVIDRAGRIQRVLLGVHSEAEIASILDDVLR